MRAYEYLLKHSQELSDRFSGKYVAIVGDEVIAASDSGLEAFRRAKGKYPEAEIHVSYMPREEELVTLL